MTRASRVGAWRRWVRRSERLIDARVLALLRILVCLCVVADLLRVASLGLVDDLYRLYDDGGINIHPDKAAVIVDLFGPDAGVVAFWLAVVSLALAMIGVLSRPAMLIGVLAYAQIGHLYNPGDRGIDRILRTVLVILLFSGAHQRFALGLRWSGRPAAAWVRAWPADLVRWLMVMIYLSAGIAKLAQQPAWLGTSALPVVYRIVTDPMAGHVDPVAALDWWWLWTLMGWATIGVELGSPLLLARWGRWWSLAALAMHLGIFLLMDLGMFSLGMAALHVVLLYPWLLPLLDRISALSNREPPPPGAWVELGDGPRWTAAPTPAG